MGVLIRDSVSDITINKCHLKDMTITTSLRPITISDVTVTNGVFDEGVSIEAYGDTGQISNVAIRDSSFRRTLLLAGVTRAALERNHFNLDGDTIEAIDLHSGSNNRVSQNIIDGGYHGRSVGSSPDSPGADDGIVLIDEDGDLVDGNTISNVYDAGIEAVQNLTNTRISNNVIINAGLAGISSYHCTRWRNDEISGNAISQSVYAMLFLYQVTGFCTPPPSPGLFSNNRFSNNVFSRPGTSPAFSASFPQNTEVTSNLIQNNDFGQGSVMLRPETGFIDGGGNVCGGGSFGCARITTQRAWP